MTVHFSCFKLLPFYAMKNTSRRSSFSAMRENKQLKGYVVKRFDSPSLLSCGQQCMRNIWCTSTNYKMSSEKDGNGTCELNKHDISLIDENINFHGQQGPGRDSHMKQTGMLVVSLRGVNFGFWSRLGCSGQSANILCRQGLI